MDPSRAPNVIDLTLVLGDQKGTRVSKHRPLALRPVVRLRLAPSYGFVILLCNYERLDSCAAATA